MTQDPSRNPGRRLFGRTRRTRALLPLSLVLLAVLLALLGLIDPGPLQVVFDPGSVSLPVLTPTPTMMPRPTDAHGGQIVFTCTRAEVNQICMINADGSGFEQLTSGTLHSYYPAISADGRDIIFAANLYEMFDLYRLAPAASEGPKSATSRLTRLTDGIGNAFSPSFSPDGSQILFVNSVEGKPGSLWLMKADGTDPHEIYSAAGTIVGAAWSADGSQAAMVVSVDSAFAYEVFVLQLGNLALPPRQVPHRLSSIGGSVSWSHDSKDLLVFAGPAAAREIYRLNPESGEATQLTFGGNNASAAYSPDGQYIVFNSLRNGGQADLYIMRSDGHSTRRLTTDPEPDWQPQWGG